MNGMEGSHMGTGWWLQTSTIPVYEDVRKVVTALQKLLWLKQLLETNHSPFNPTSKGQRDKKHPDLKPLPFQIQQSSLGEPP